MTAPKRRWFRFSLRALLLALMLFAFCLCWLAYQLNWIRQRRAALVERNASTKLQAEAPGMLGLFGEPGFEWIGVSFPPRAGWGITDSEQEEIARLQRLFPEAKTIAWDTGQRHNGYPVYNSWSR